MEQRSGRFRKKKVCFSMVSNTLIRDDSISLKAKGLYSLIQSYITLDDFTLYKSYLQTRCAEGDKAFNSAWKELKEKGYLIQYKLQDERKKFYYEYELLDEPEPHTYFAGVASGDMQNADMQNRVDINNTIQNNIISNNTNLSINQKDGLIDIDSVKQQIEYDYFEPYQQERVNELALLILEVYRLPDTEKIKINQTEIIALYVKERFKLLNSSHIRYVLKCLNDTGKIKNMKMYLITALFNAPITMTSYYANLTL